MDDFGIKNQPRIQKSNNFIQEIDLNYQATQAYFIQKQLAFCRLIANKEEDKDNKIEEAMKTAMNNLIVNEWQKINDQIVKQNLNIYGGQAAKYTIKETADWTNIPEWLKERILNNPNGTNNIFSLLGLAYEEWLHNAMQSSRQWVEDETINGLLANFFKSVSQTGAYKSNSSIRIDNMDIRPDLASGIGEKRDGVYYDKNGDVAVELQTTFNIESYRKQHGMYSAKSIAAGSREMLKQYIESPMVGFSVKRWTSDTSEARKLTSASGMKQMVNNMFDQSHGKTWNAIYAYRSMVRLLSQYLIDILGPVNIAFITGHSFEWTSEFLSDALLTMNIYTKELLDNEEIHPYVQSSNIYVQHYKRGRKQALEAQTFNKDKNLEKMSGKGWEAYQLSFKIDQRRERK